MNPLTTYIVTDNIFADHKTGNRHPECPDRHTYIDQALRDNGLLTRDNTIKPRDTSDEELSLCHPDAYIRLVESETRDLSQRKITTLSTGDVQICSQSFSIAKLAVGGVLNAVDHVMKNVVNKVFCNVRPPGHHACGEKGMGFCLFNNIAVGARYAQRQYGVERVLIIDWDVHHGNGTQDIFYNDPSVFYFSTHQKGIYPFTGTAEEQGDGEAIGTTLNVPIKGGKDSRVEVLSAFDEQLLPAMERFKPELIFISAGFDGHKSDPIGGFDLETRDFADLTEKVNALANKYCGGKIISVLEGGYNLEAIATSSVAHVQALN
jgi:acetoin utilization deacetylase AcuC-like enzyme